MSRNILFIAFEFPPINTGGSHRPYKLANAVLSHGWTPIVLTVDTQSLGSSLKLDENLSQKVDQRITVIRAAVRPIKSWDRVLERGYGTAPDIIWRRWRKAIVSTLPNLLEKYKPKAIYITFPPFSLNALVVWLRKRHPEIRIVSDMRDAWSNWVISPYASYWHFKQIQHQEKQLLTLSDQIIVTSRQTIKDFKSLYPLIPESRFAYLPNGFDQFLQPHPSIPKTSGKLRIGYIGSFYYNPVTQRMMHKAWYKKKPYQWFQHTPRAEDWSYRSPRYFFRLLRQFQNAYPELYTHIELIFAGTKPSWFGAMADEYGVSQMITHLGPVTQKESLEVQASCDWLLLTSAKVIGGKDYSIAGKTFEYMSLQKPILGLVCDGAQKDLLEKSGAACLVDPDKPEEGIESLKEIVEGTYKVHPNQSFISEFKMEKLARKFVEILDNL